MSYPAVIHNGGHGYGNRYDSPSAFDRYIDAPIGDVDDIRAYMRLPKLLIVRLTGCQKYPLLRLPGEPTNIQRRHSLWMKVWMITKIKFFPMISNSIPFLVTPSVRSRISTITSATTAIMVSFLEDVNLRVLLMIIAEDSMWGPEYIDSQQQHPRQNQWHQSQQNSPEKRRLYQMDTRPLQVLAGHRTVLSAPHTRVQDAP